MNTECASSSVLSNSPRFQQPRITVSPSENAAAGDALRSQISSESNLNLSSSAEIIAMDNSCPSVSQLWRFSNDPIDKVASTTDKDNSWNNPVLGSRLVNFNDEESGFGSDQLSRKLVKCLKDSDCTDLESRKPFEICSVNERADIDKIISPDRKISMFSAEIWTEKVLPSKTVVYPEPELVELYFDKNTTPDRLNRFGGYSTESIEVPPIWKRSDLGVLGSTTSTSPPLSARKSKTSSSGQKTINFDDEIWPVCPMLIPSEREFSQSVLRNKYDSISPERLNKSSEETATINRLESEPPSIKDVSTALDVPSSSGSKEYKLENNSEDRKVVEPTHEIECQNACINSPKMLQKFYNVERISRETNSVANTPRRLQKNNNLGDEDFEADPPTGVTDRRFKEKEKKKVVKKFIIDHEQCKTQHSKNNILFVSNSEPVNRIPDDIADRKQKMPSSTFNENLSVNKIGEDSKPRLEACPVMKQISFHQIFSDSSPDSEFRAVEAENLDTSVIKRKIKKNRKGVKVVRFQTCDKTDDIQIDETVQKDAKNCETNYLRQKRSGTQFVIDDRNEAPEFLSVESFRQEVNHKENKIARHIEMDPALDDALETLAKIERIVDSNHRTEEKLKQLQPNVAIPWMTPPDAGKLLAEALMRCRNYMLNNGYNRGATITMNKLLTSKVQNLKQLVERQRLTLIAQEKQRSALSAWRQSSRSNHDHFPNFKGSPIANEIGTNQMKLLIGDILASTEKLLPKLTANQTQKKSSVNGSKNSTKSNRIPSDAVHFKTNKTGSPKELNVRSEAQESKANVREDEIAQSQHKEFESVHSFVTPATNPKKPAPNEPPKTLKKLFNDLLLENRPKTLPRYYNVNDSMNNFRSLLGPHNNSVSQKLPAWKPGGSNLVQSSVNIIPNNQKIRSLPTSSANKRKNSANEQTRETKSHHRNKVTPVTVKDPLKTIGKSIAKPHDATTSFAKVRKDQIKGHQSEVASLDKRKVQLPNEVFETRARKPRSKSRTRTKSLIKIPKITVTEIPLEHVKEYSPTVEQKTAVAKELAVSKKASSYPKGIIKMLEELIRSSSHETSIRNASSLQIVARCNAAAKEDVSNFLPLKSKGRASTETESRSSDNQEHYGSEASFENKSNQLKLAKEVTVSEVAADVIDDVTDPHNMSKESDLSLNANTVEILSTSRSNSEINGNRIIEELNTLSVSDGECKAELGSEHFIGCISSKYCQASLTSLTSQEISEEIIRSQISDTASYCEETPKGSNESLDTVEDDEVTRDECVHRFQRDQSVSIESGVTPKKKFVNRHARSLEMLKNILSDQGLGIHLLSRAESEMKDRRCKCSSSKRGMTARRSSGAKSCGEIVSGTSLPDRDLSSTLFSKLATLSESESDIEQVEVATMTSAGSINHHEVSNDSESQCSKRDKSLSIGIVTVENATQFDIPLKSDISVGDEFVLDTFLLPKTRDEHILKDNFKPLRFNHEGQELHKNETFECKLPDDILEAFRLAAFRATNLCIAFQILERRTPFGTIRNSNEILTHSSTSRSESVEDINDLLSGHVRSLGKAFNSDCDEKSLKQSDNPKSVPPLKIIIPRIRKNLENDRSELDTEKSQARSSAIGMTNSDDKMTVDKSQKFGNLDKVNSIKPSVRPKPFEMMRKSSVLNIDGKTVLYEHEVDPNYMTFSGNKQLATLRMKGDQLPSPYRRSSTSKSENEKLIETLHFAGRQSPSVIGHKSEFIDVTMNSQSLNGNFLNYGSSKTATKIQESVPGSRMKTLLEENLQRFRIDYGPINDELIFKDFRDPTPTESTDDEVVINEVFVETAISTPCTHLADYNILSEVKSIVNCLLNEVTENWESSAVIDHQDVPANLSRYRRVRRPVRRTKSDRGRKIVKCGNCSLFCAEYFNFFSSLIISRDHLLSLIYAVVCSFVFCCLQFSVYCEVS